MGGPAGLAMVLEEISAPGALESLVTHPFGNYVVQRAISQCTAAQLDALGQRINGFATESDKLAAVAAEAALEAGEAPPSPDSGGARSGGRRGGKSGGGKNGGGGGGQGGGKSESFRKSAHGRNMLYI